MTTSSAILHAGLVARRKGGFWKGVLLLGDSGTGKSDLALRLVERGWSLVADDRVLVWADEARRFGRAPEPLTGLIELRGQGVLEGAPWLSYSEIVLVVSSVERSVSLERTPSPRVRNVQGAALPCFDVHPLDASAPARILALFDRL
jgi:serine kinase of HPr protein (carbohydrate metabolism regulator)